MPRIPSYVSDARINGTPLPQASALAFNEQAGLGAVGQGLQNLSGDLEQIALKKAHDDEIKWLTDAGPQLSMTLANFQADPANNSKETYATDFQKFAEDTITEYSKAAPTKEAALRFKASAGHEMASRYDVALRTSERTKIDNAVLGVTNATSNLMASFRADAGTSPEYAAGNVQNWRLQILSGIDTRFGTLAPDTALKLKEQVDRDLILGTMRQAPAYAKELAETSPHLDEQTRSALLSRIETVVDENTQLARDATQDSLEEIAQRALDSGQPVIFPPKSTYTIFGDKADLVQQKAERKFSQINQGFAIVAKLADKNTPYQLAELSKMAGNVDSEAFQIARQRLHMVQKQQAEDPQGYMMAHNERVQSAMMASSQPNSAHLRGFAYDLSLKYQGYAPDGSAPEEAARYLNLPTGARHILTAAQAEGMADEINRGAPGTKMQAIQQLIASFPEQQRAQAFNDLVTLPPQGKGISQAMQLALLNSDKSDIKDLMGAVSNVEAIRKLSDETKRDYEAELFTNPTWKRFAQTMVGDNWQRATEIQGFKDSILAYAYATGEKPSRAVDKSVDKWIGSNFGFTEVNGQALGVELDRGPGKPRRTEQDVLNYGLRLSDALLTLPAESIKQEDEFGRSLFPSLPPTEPEKTKHLKKAITASGFFKTEADGQSVTLYAIGDDGHAFQVVNKKNQPFTWRFDELPTLERSRERVEGFYK